MSKIVISAILFFCISLGVPGTYAEEVGPVVIGVVYNTTGQQQVLDTPSLNGALLAADQASENGGVLNRPLDLVVVDGQSDVAVSAKKTAVLISSHPGMSALMGASDSDLVLPAAEAAAAAGRLFLTSGATSPELPAEVPKYLYLACFGDNVQAAAAAQWSYNTRKARTASIIYDSEKTYTRLLQRYFKEQFEAMGGKINSVSSYTVESMSNLADGLENADIIFLASEQAEDAAKAAQILRAAGHSTPILGGDGYDAPAVWAQHPQLRDIFYTTHAYIAADNPDPYVVAFIKAYTAAYPGQEPDSFAALGYDTVGLLTDAITRAGSDSPDRVRTALSTTTLYRGVTGTISFELGSRIPTKSVALVALNNGKPSLVEEITPDKVPAP